MIAFEEGGGTFADAFHWRDRPFTPPVGDAGTRHMAAGRARRLRRGSRAAGSAAGAVGATEI